MAPQIAKYGIDIQIVRPEMTKFKMFRDMDFYFVGITFDTVVTIFNFSLKLNMATTAGKKF